MAAVKAKSKASKAKKAVASKKPVARKKVAKKVAAKPARKRAAKKPAAKAAKVVAKNESRVAELLADFRAQMVQKASQSAEQAQATGKKAGLAYLGMYGTAYDFAKDQYAKAVDAREARIASFVKRGEAVQDEAKAALEGIELPKSVRDMKELDADAVKDMIKARVEDAKSRADEMGDMASAKFEELKGRVMPASA